MKKVTKQHMDALARHLADVLGDPDTTRGELALTGIGLDETTTYVDLASVTLPVVAAGLTAAGITLKPLRHGTVVALFGLVREGAPTCTRCWRLRLQLAGSTWQAVTASTCPVDAGLYEVPVVSAVIGWHDGREYPEGTTHDGEGVPLTEAAIRAERTVDASVDAACSETGATLCDVLAAIPDATPAEALTVIGEPLRTWPGVNAMRAFVRNAKGALTRRVRRTPQPANAAVQSGTVNEHTLRKALVYLYPHVSDARRLTAEIGLASGRIDFAGAATHFWFTVVNEARNANRLSALLATALREYPDDPVLRAI